MFIAVIQGLDAHGGVWGELVCCSIRSDRGSLGVQEVTQSRGLTHRHAFKSLDVCGLELDLFGT